MRHLWLALAALVMLSGCGAKDSERTLYAENPFQTCQRATLGVGSEMFDQCVQTSIVIQCKATGHPAGSPDHARCERRFQDIVVVSRELEIRGYRGFDQWRLN